ncbi:MAG: DUF294 nucleotidyltransferase-like domain-containing protein [Micrococcales bacterium]|nr:DUF294 nucleotidyltransferase-like domain-containing protein [Micrococcales bacterium]
METELREVRDFLAAHAPFEGLPGRALDRLPAQLTMRYFRRGSTLISVGEANDTVYVLRSGAVDITDASGVLVERSAEGTTVGTSNILRGGRSQHDVRAIEDTLALAMSGDDFRELVREHPDLHRFFVELLASRLRAAVQSQQRTDQGGAILKTRVGELISREPITIAVTATIREAAELMAAERVSSLLVTGLDKAGAGAGAVGQGGEGAIGILTDKDLRSRVLAVGRDPGDPVAEVMTSDPVTVGPDTMAFEVLMEMVAKSIHHMPVVRPDGRPLGLVTGTDLIRLEHASPVYLVSDIRKQTSVAGLAELGRRLPRLVEQLVSQDATADDIGRVVTAVGDAVERRLLELAEAELGAPPVPYCWVVFGSRGRLEQGLSSDQDNALLISDEMQPEHEEWFARLAEWVVDALERCGYARCPGDIMATNPRWRQPISQWRREFGTWLRQPEPDAILNATIFFDMRPVHGDASLEQDLHRWVLAQTPHSKAFLAHMVRSAVDHEPPLGFFRGFVLQKEGEHKDTLDLKIGGVGAVVELARVHALAHGLAPVNTQARIEAVADAGVMSRDRAADLRDAFEFISYVRLRHQARQVSAGQQPDNFVAPTELSDFERRHLRDAFQVVRSAQSTLGAVSGSAL